MDIRFKAFLEWLKFLEMVARMNTAKPKKLIWDKRFLQSIDGNFLMQVVEEPTRKGALLDLVLTNKKGRWRMWRLEVDSAAVTMKWSSSGSCMEEAGQYAGSKPWTSGGLTLASSGSYSEESRGPGLSKAGGPMSAGRSLNNISSMHRSNASPWERNGAKEAGDLHS